MAAVFTHMVRRPARACPAFLALPAAGTPPRTATFALGTLLDINECTAAHNCHQHAICTNLPGSYNCTCETGYAGNGLLCDDINECEMGSHDCHQEADCLNRPGSYHCQCRVNFRGNGTYCEFHAMRLDITCKTNCGDLVSSSRPFRLLANCSNCPGGARPSYTWYLYQDSGWHSRNGSLLTEVDLPPLTTTGIHAVSLSVKQGSLEVREKYRVWLYGVVTGVGDGWAELVMRTNSPPENGTCTISPASGYAYQTRFTIKCEGWSDDNTGANGSLSYFFFAKVGDDSTLLMHGSDAETPPIYIRVGDPGGNWTVDVDIRIIGVTGDYKSFSLGVQVLPRPDWSTLTVDNDYLRRTIAAHNASLQSLGSDTCTLVTTAVEAVGSLINNDAWNTTGRYFIASGNAVSSVPKEQREQDRLLIATFLEDNWGCGTSVGDLIQYVSALESLTYKTDELTYATKEKAVQLLTNTIGLFEVRLYDLYLDDFHYLASDVASIISNLLESALEMLTEYTPNFDLSPAEIIWYEKEFGLRSANEGMLLKNLMTQLMAALNKYIRVINKRLLVGEPRFEVIRPSFELLIDRSFPDDVGNRVIETGHGSVILPGKEVLFNDDGAKEFVDVVILLMYKNPYSWNTTAPQLSTPVMEVFFIADENKTLVMEDLEDFITLKLPNNGSKSADVQKNRFSSPGEMLYYKVLRNSDHEALILILTDVSESVDFEVFAQKGQPPNETDYVYKAVETSRHGSMRLVIPSEALNGTGAYFIGVREVIQDGVSSLNRSKRSCGNSQGNGSPTCGNEPISPDHSLQNSSGSLEHSSPELSSPRPPGSPQLSFPSGSLEHSSPGQFSSPEPSGAPGPSGSLGPSGSQEYSSPRPSSSPAPSGLPEHSSPGPSGSPEHNSPRPSSSPGPSGSPEHSSPGPSGFSEHSSPGTSSSPEHISPGPSSSPGPSGTPEHSSPGPSGSPKHISPGPSGSSEDSTPGTSGSSEDSPSGASGSSEDSPSEASGSLEDSPSGTSGSSEDSTPGTSGSSEDSPSGASGSSEDSISRASGSSEHSSPGPSAFPEQSLPGITAFPEESSPVVGANTNSEEVECLCNHLTAFGADFAVAPNSINFSTVFAKFGQLDENPVVFSFVISTLVLYFALLVWARRKDKSDLKNWAVSPVEGNRPGDTCGYLVNITTGQRLGAGTASNVGVIIYGTEGETGARRLRDANKKVFSRGHINSFLLTTPRPLGSLTHLNIWHDNSGKGSRAGWFLDNVVVKDLQANQTFYFQCNQWLAVDQDDGRVSRVLPVDGWEQITDFQNLFSKRQVEQTSSV
ncbi:uncharacterized protein LOC144907963 [Branchiostoma floridae x Branchiostoma belcheri]